MLVLMRSAAPYALMEKVCPLVAADSNFGGTVATMKLIASACSSWSCGVDELELLLSGLMSVPCVHCGGCVVDWLLLLWCVPVEMPVDLRVLGA